jgi:signal transduction histidine kinase
VTNQPTQPAAAKPQGLPLAVRLGLVLGATVLVVLVLAGAVVNRVVSQGFEDVVGTQQVEAVEAAADALGELVRVGGGPRQLAEGARIMNRLARSLDGPVTLLGPDGTQLALVQPPGPPPQSNVSYREIQSPITTPNGLEVGTLIAQVPNSGSATGEDRPFLRLFNVALLVAGLVSVAVIAGVSVWMARRQTRPLQDVAAAATRLGAGDLSARATGGGDRESQELAGAFNAMAGRLESSEMLRRRAASDMAHDLATPATVLQGQLQAMIDGVVPKSKANLEAAAASAAALGGVIVQMGELASAEAAPLQAKPETMWVAAAVGEAAAALDGLYRERGVALNVEQVGQGVTAFADPVHLGRALRNVLTNAAQHTPAGKTVRVSATPLAPTLPGEMARVEIRVIDQGPGIPAEDLPHIFERFYRSDPARATGLGAGSGETAAAGAGAGIGLTIARELLAASGGTIAVERTGPEGTTVLIGLRPAAPGG